MTNKISWDTYFMNISICISKRSPDPKKQVGAVIVDSSNRIVSTGYNGLPSGISEDIDWYDRDSIRDLILHAENNAILYIKSKESNLKLYTTLSPCKDSIKLIKTAGINTVYYNEKYKKFEDTLELCKIFDISLIEVLLPNDTLNKNNMSSCIIL